MPFSPSRTASTKIVGLPALISVASTLPTPGTSSRSILLPVGNIAPPVSSPPSSSAAGSRNSSPTSGAGKATPQSPRRAAPASADGERADRGGEVAAIARPVDHRRIDRDLAEQIVDVAVGTIGL